MSLNSFIAKQFANPAGLGGKIVSFVMNRQNLPMYYETIRLLSPSGSDRILDIGCGNGTVLNMLARQVGGAYAGVDTSKSIIKAASRRNHSFIKNSKMTFACQDAGAMSFADRSFSKAYTINTVYFWDDIQNILSEIRRVLKPNGFFINTFYTNETLARFSHTQFGYKRFTVDQLTDAGINAGFSVDVIPILHGTAYCLLYRRIE